MASNRSHKRRNPRGDFSEVPAMPLDIPGHDNGVDNPRLGGRFQENSCEDVKSEPAVPCVGIGDCVQLKSGGARMVVDLIADGRAKVVWMVDPGIMYGEWVSIYSLKLAES